MSRFLLTVTLGLILAARAYSADVVLICNGGAPSAEAPQVELSARFYGLTLSEVSVGAAGGAGAAMRALRDQHVFAVIITAQALPLLNKDAVFRALQRDHGRAVPLLIEGVTPSASSALLSSWSGGAVIGAVGPVEGSTDGEYRFSPIQDVTRQLGGRGVPASGAFFHRLVIDERTPPEVIVSFGSGGTFQPILARAHVGDREIFLQSLVVRAGAPPKTSSEDLLTGFLRLAPSLLFLRYAGGERVWHAPMQVANFTIDDAWLREPYGNLDYERLLGDMVKHNFHTTIAFIPWNFDRNSASVAKLFLAHPDRFSIAVHGNNHDGKDFCADGPCPPARQAEAIRQAIARMESFTKLTGVPYAPVMVWPYEKAPLLSTLTMLKKYNFLANVNTVPVPTGQASPAEPLFRLRPESVQFGDFPTIKRYSPQTPWVQSKIAVNSFLGNPLLFYVDPDVFEGGDAPLDEIADYVNHVDAGVVWEGLGQIARHLYLIRLAGDGAYDVQAFASEITLINPSSDDAAFSVEKPETFEVPIRSVTVNGRPVSYHRTGDGLDLSIRLGGKETADVRVVYDNDLDVGRIDTSRRSVHAYLHRSFADFRDIILARSRLGQALIAGYYKSGPPQVALAVSALLLAGAVFWLVTRRRARLSSKRGSGASWKSRATPDVEPPVSAVEATAALDPDCGNSDR